MSLDPLSIAHLGFARRPLVAIMLGLWDEIVAAIVEMQHGGGHVVIGKSTPRPTPRRDGRRRRFPEIEETQRHARRVADEEFLLAVL